MQGHAEGLEARSPRPAESPRRARPQHPSRCRSGRRSTHSAQTGEARLAARGRPTLMTAAQVAVASRSGSELLAARRVPAPRAAASSPTAWRAGLVGGAGAWHSPARAPRGATPPSPLPAPRSRPPGAGLGACTRRCDWAGSPATGLRLGPGRPAGLTSRWSRDSTSRSLRFPLGEMETVMVPVSGSH